MKHILHALVVAVILLFIAGVYAGINIYNGIDDAYAQWGAADMVIDHMRDNGGKWPPNWESLRGYYEKGGGRVSGWSFSQFQSHVYIDFNADVEQIHRLSFESDSATFDVIHATSFWGAQMGDGPNAMLRDYFRGEEAGKKTEMPSPPAPLPKGEGRFFTPPSPVSAEYPSVARRESP